MSQRVLVVDDEPMVREVLCQYLERDGFAVTEAGDAVVARQALDEAHPDLVVLDVMLPGGSGLDVLREIRKTSEMPVILLTARSDEADRVAGLELGADDYVVKPFSPREVAARVKSVLRRTRVGAEATVPAGPIEVGRLSVNVASRIVLLDGDEVDLTPKEFDLLAFLVRNPQQVFSRAELLAHVWESSPDWQDPATVTVHVRRLRQKVERDATEPDHLKTVFGVGYRFEP